VVFDGARADEELRSDLAVGVSLASQPGNLLFLWRELIKRVYRPLSSTLTGRLQLDARTFGKRFHPEVAEEVVGEPELRPGVQPSPLAP